MGVWYCTREDVKASLEIARTSRTDQLIDRRIEAASRAIEACLHRRFYPEIKTVDFDYPNYDFSPTWMLRLGDNELASDDGITLTSGGQAISGSDFFASRYDGKREPPYSLLQLDLAEGAAFGGTNFQRNIQVQGTFGYRDDNEPAGAVVSNINSSVTTVDIKPLSSRLGIGVGSLIRVGTERMIITDRMSLYTGQILQEDLTDRKSDTAVEVADGSTFGLLEIITLGSERMQIVDITGTTLIVDRAFDGTVLSTHSAEPIFAQRRFTVQRGVLGSTAASHAADDQVDVFVFPGLINEYAVAEAVVMLEQNAAGYARVVGSGEAQREAAGLGLDDIRQRAYTAYGRKSRLRAI